MWTLKIVLTGFVFSGALGDLQAPPKDQSFVSLGECVIAASATTAKIERASKSVSGKFEATCEKLGTFSYGGGPQGAILQLPAGSAR